MIYARYYEGGRIPTVLEGAFQTAAGLAFLQVFHEAVEEVRRRQVLEMTCLLTGEVYPRQWGNPEVRP